MNPAAFGVGGVVRVGRRNMGVFLPTRPPRNVVQFQGDTPWNPGKGASPLCTPRSHPHSQGEVLPFQGSVIRGMGGRGRLKPSSTFGRARGRAQSPDPTMIGGRARRETWALFPPAAGRLSHPPTQEGYRESGGHPQTPVRGGFSPSELPCPALVGVMGREGRATRLRRAGMPALRFEYRRAGDFRGGIRTRRACARGRAGGRRW